MDRCRSPAGGHAAAEGAEKAADLCATCGRPGPRCRCDHTQPGGGGRARAPRAPLFPAWEHGAPGGFPAWPPPHFLDWAGICQPAWGAAAWALPVLSARARDYAEERPEAYHAFLRHTKHGAEGAEVGLAGGMCLDHHVSDLLLCLESWLAREGGPPLAGQPWRLARLDLARNGLSDGSIACILKRLKQLDVRVRRLDLDSNRTGAEGMSALVEYIWNCPEPLFEIGIADNRIAVQAPDAGGDSVSGMLRCLYNHPSYPRKVQFGDSTEVIPVTIRLAGNKIAGCSSLLAGIRDKGGPRRVRFCSSKDAYVTDVDEYLSVHLPGFEQQRAACTAADDAAEPRRHSVASFSEGPGPDESDSVITAAQADVAAGPRMDWQRLKRRAGLMREADRPGRQKQRRCAAAELDGEADRPGRQKQRRCAAARLTELDGKPAAVPLEEAPVAELGGGDRRPAAVGSRAAASPVPGLRSAAAVPGGGGALRRGRRLPGRVALVREDFALVDLGTDMEGLLHSTDLLRPTRKVDRVLGVGDPVYVEVRAVCRRRGRISLRQVIEQEAEDGRCIREHHADRLRESGCVDSACGSSSAPNEGEKAACGHQLEHRSHEVAPGHAKLRTRGLQGTSSHQRVRSEHDSRLRHGVQLREPEPLRPQRPGVPPVTHGSAKQSPGIHVRKAAAEGTESNQPQACEPRESREVIRTAGLCELASSKCSNPAASDQPQPMEPSADAPTRGLKEHVLQDEGEEGLDFPVLGVLSSEEQCHLECDITAHLRELLGPAVAASARKDLAEFVVCLLLARRRPAELRRELGAFLGAGTGAFLAWLGDVLRSRATRPPAGASA